MCTPIQIISEKLKKRNFFLSKKWENFKKNIEKFQETAG